MTAAEDHTVCLWYSKKAITKVNTTQLIGCYCDKGFDILCTCISFYRMMMKINMREMKTLRNCPLEL